jgi:hypothetical protein
MAAVMSVVGSLLLVVSLFDTLGRLRTPETRETVAEFLARPPGSGLGIDVAQAVDLMRALALLSGALAAAALVFAVFVLQRHGSARIGFTVVAGLLLLTVPVAGLMPLLLAFAALLMWSQPARDWYAGRAPTPATAAPGRSRPPALSEERPAPSRFPFGSAPRPPAEEPQPEGTAPPAQTEQPAPQPPHPPNQPYPGYAGYPAMGYPQPPRDPDRRPTTVLIAAVLTWLGAGAAALGMVVFVLVLATGGDAFVDEFNRAAEGSQLRLGRDEVLAAGWAIASLFLVWSLVAMVLAYLAFRRSNAARIVLAVSAGMTALVSLVMILSGVSLLTLALSVTAGILLFTGGANEWYSRRSRPGQGYPGHPAEYGSWPGYPGYPTQDQQPPQQSAQQPPQQPSERPKPW